MVRLPPMILNLLFFHLYWVSFKYLPPLKNVFPAGNATIEVFFFNFISKSIVPSSQIFQHRAKLISGFENVLTVTGYCSLYHLLTRKINPSWIQYQAQEINLSTICSQSIPGLSPGRDYQYLSNVQLNMWSGSQLLVAVWRSDFWSRICNFTRLATWVAKLV